MPAAAKESRRGRTSVVFLKGAVGLLIYAIFLLAACGPLATPTMSPEDVQATAFSSASTMMALTDTAVPTMTPATPTSRVPSPESSAVEIAVLNMNAETQVDGTIKNTAALSIEPLGLGTLELSSPATMKLEESSVIRLLITPDSALEALPKVSAPTVSANEPDYLLAFSDQLQIYPVMIAELQGVNFDIVSDNRPEKPVTSTMPVEWVWSIRPRSAGRQQLFLAISVPVVIDQIRGVASAQILKSVTIEIQVELTPTPLPSQTPEPTSTPTPIPPIKRIGERLIDDAGKIVAALITLIGALATAFGAYMIAKNARLAEAAKKAADAEAANKKAAKKK